MNQAEVCDKPKTMTATGTTVPWRGDRCHKPVPKERVSDMPDMSRWQVRHAHTLDFGVSYGMENGGETVIKCCQIATI